MAAERSEIRRVPREDVPARERVWEERTYRPEVDFRGDRVYWGPIVIGFLTALTTMALLSLLGLATGLTSINAGASATQGVPVNETGINSLLWTGVSGIIAFMLGGFVTARTSATYDRGWGMLNGMMVFTLMLPFTLWLATVGMSAIAGGLGAFAGGMVSGFGPDAVRGSANAASQATTNLSPADIAAAATRAAETARNAAWVALLGGILGLLASAIGGYLGTREPSTVAFRTTSD